MVAKGMVMGNEKFKNVSKDQIQTTAAVRVIFPGLESHKSHSWEWAGKFARWKLPFWELLENRDGSKIVFKTGAEILSLPRIYKI